MGKTCLYAGLNGILMRWQQEREKNRNWDKDMLTQGANKTRLSPKSFGFVQCLQNKATHFFYCQVCFSAITKLYVSQAFNQSGIFVTLITFWPTEIKYLKWCKYKWTTNLKLIYIIANTSHAIHCKQIKTEAMQIRLNLFWLAACIYSILFVYTTHCIGCLSIIRKISLVIRLIILSQGW